MKVVHEFIEHPSYVLTSMEAKYKQDIEFKQVQHVPYSEVNFT